MMLSAVESHEHSVMHEGWKLEIKLAEHFKTNSSVYIKKIKNKNLFCLLEEGCWFRGTGMAQW